MSNPLPSLRARSQPFPMWFWISCVFFVLVLVGFSTEAYSQENAPGSRAQDKIAWMSGGVGSEARDYMRREAGDYNVHLTFSGRQGHYLANIPYAVHQQGKEIHAGTADGPLLYLRLPPGTYQISAELDGERQQKRITVGSGGRTSKVVFAARQN